MLYKSKILDLRPFGITKIQRAMLTADALGDLSYRVSFDSGKTWRVVRLNTPFFVADASTQVKVEIKFPPSSGITEPTVNVSGVFPLAVGTTVFFQNSSGKTSTVVGLNGRYSVSIAPGIYTVYYIRAGTREVLFNDYNPELFVYRQPDDLDKENTIQLYMSDVQWASYSVYDTFKDTSKMAPESTAHIDLMHNLRAKSSSAMVRYWALVFNTIET